MVGGCVEASTTPRRLRGDRRRRRLHAMRVRKRLPLQARPWSPRPAEALRGGEHGRRACARRVPARAQQRLLPAVDTIRELAASLTADDRIGICAASLIELDGAPSKSHVTALTLGLCRPDDPQAEPRSRSADRGTASRRSVVPLACAAIRRSLWEQVSRAWTSASSSTSRTRTSAGACGPAACEVAVDWEAVAVHVGGATSVTARRAALVRAVRAKPRALPPEALRARMAPVRGRLDPFRLVRSLAWAFAADRRRAAGPGPGGAPRGPACGMRRAAVRVAQSTLAPVKLAVRNLGSNYLVYGASVVSGLVLTPIIISALGKEGYGAWIFIASLTTMLRLLDFGITPTVVASRRSTSGGERGGDRSEWPRPALPST